MAQIHFTFYLTFFSSRWAGRGWRHETASSAAGEEEEEAEAEVLASEAAAAPPSEPSRPHLRSVTVYDSNLQQRNIFVSERRDR